MICTGFVVPHHSNNICKRSFLILAAAGTNKNNNKKLEVYTKVKRLKQMIEGGQSYQDFVTEQRKYEGGETSSIGTDQIRDQESKEDEVEYQATFRKAVAAGLISAFADPAEVMKKVLQYKAANKSGSSSGEGMTTKKTITKRIAFLPDGSSLDNSSTPLIHLTLPSNRSWPHPSL